MILALLEPDFAGEHLSDYDYTTFMSAKYWEQIYPSDIFIAYDRFYFPLPKNPHDPPLAADPSLEVGKTLDYIYPQ